MYQLSATSLLLLATVFTQSAVHATKLSQKEYQTFTNRGSNGERKELYGRREGNPYINIVKGIFNSNKGSLIQNVADIPCEVIETLESDADQAEQFVSQIQAGQIPSAITDLPEAAVSEFGAIIDVATMVIEDVAEAVVTDVVQVFNEIEDGSITSVIEGIPEDIIDAITNGWDDFTSEVQSVWGDVACFFEGDCPDTSSARSCGTPAAASASATANTAAASASASYASGSRASEAAAAAYTSSYYASETAAEASEYYASESSAAAASAANQAGSTTTIPGAHTTTQTTPQGTSQPTQPLQPSSRGLMSYRLAESHALAVTAMTVLGLAFWL